MKRFISLCVALMLIVSLSVAASATGEAVAADGWSVANDNYLGWTMENGVITGDFNVGWENAEPISLWKDMLTDLNNFTIELDITASNMTSPFIAVMGVRVETDGNGGDGNQVFLKTNNTENFDGNNQNHDWIKAAGCKAHVTICRIDGGDLTIQIVGESTDAVVGETKTLTMTPSAESAEVTIGVYRGAAKFEGLTVSGAPTELPTDPPATEPQPSETEPQKTEPEESKPEQTEPKATEPSGSNDAGDNTVLWVVIAAVAVVAAVVVVVVVSKKKKA